MENGGLPGLPFVFSVKMDKYGNKQNFAYETIKKSYVNANGFMLTLEALQ